MRVTDEFLRKFSMNLHEYEIIVEGLSREPNETELYIFSAMWSEHCGYKHSRRLLKEYFKIADENAGLVWIDNLGIAFKVESHNHPCAVEPFQGAATGVGGIIRDVIAMGARPIALLDSLHFAEPLSYTYEEVISGISTYGNSIGVPTIGGEVRFDPRYSKNPLVNVMAVGVVKREELRSARARGGGNVVVLIGAKTGKDGLHGASFASRQIDKNLNDRPSVQVGDPFTEKRLIEAMLEIVKLKSVIAVQDMGAAGILSSTTEMAERGGFGLDLYLDRVPLRENDMEPWEILLSESQERMALVVEKGATADVKAIANKWDLEFAEIGTITAGDLFRVFANGKMIASLPLSLVVKAPDFSREISSVYESSKEISKWTDHKIEGTLVNLLSDPTIASKRSVYEKYDYTVGGLTVREPGADAAVLYLEDKKGISLSLNGNARYTEVNPRGGIKAVLMEVCSNVIAAGGKPLGVTDCMNFGNPEREEIATQFYESVRGLSEGCELLGIPVTGGNVSFYNESEGVQIPPTPVIGVVGEVEDIQKIPFPYFKFDGDFVYLIGKHYVARNGASLYSKDHKNHKAFPEVDWNECAKVLDKVHKLIKEGLILSIHDVSDGGIAVSCAEMVIQSMKGVRISTDCHPFEEYPARFIAEVQVDKIEKFEKMLEDIEFTRLGTVEGNDFVWNNEVIDLSILKNAFEIFEEPK